MSSEFTLTLEKNIPEGMVEELSNRIYFISPNLESLNVNPTSIKGVWNGEKGSLPEIKEKIVSFINDFLESMMQIPEDTLFDHSERQCSCSEDPYEDLIAQGELHEEMRGVFVQGPLITNLWRVFNQKFDSIIEKYQMNRYSFPALINPDILEETGYLNEYPHNAGFVSHLEENIQSIQSFSENIKSGNKKTIDASHSEQLNTKATLSPAVCYHFYPLLANKSIPNEGIWGTAESKCFRYESKAMNSLTRLWDFTMREFIFAGPKDVLEKYRKEFLETELPTWFDELELNYKLTTANDPFFSSEENSKRAFQLAFKLKYEARCLLPYSGKSMACASINYHQDHFSSIYKFVVEESDELAHTFCFGIGLERLAFAFLAQHGLDSSKWPQKVQEQIKGLAK
mgnify:CR=1 FL=1